LVYSIRNREKLRDKTGDPWGGRTLEWAVASPAPFYNFSHTPQVSQIDDYWYEKEEAIKKGVSHRDKDLKYDDIHMPKDTPVGFIIAMFAGLWVFSLVWHMIIPGVVGFVGMILTVIVRSFNTDTDYYVPAQQVHDIEMEHLKEATS
jgi:cytochrome o ubiquinol oxidase subunit I